MVRKLVSIGPRRAFALLAAAALLGGCGASAGNSRSLIDQAFARPIGSANVSIDVTAALSGGSEGRAGPILLRLAGPYQSNGSRKIPSFNWAFSFTGAGRSLSGALTSTGDDAYLTVGPTSYDFGAQRIAQLNAQLASGGHGRSLASFGIDPQAWMVGATNQGSADIGGVQTTHVRAGVDVRRMLKDLDKAAGSAGGTLGSSTIRQLSSAQIDSIANAIHHPTIDVYIGQADLKLRRVAVAMNFSVPSRDRARLGGLSGGSISFSIEFSAVGQHQTIAPPPNSQPLTQLPGGVSGVKPKQLQAYSQCLQHAGASTSALQRCAQLLR